MHILLFILFFIIAIIVFGLSIVGFLLRTIFGIGRRSSSSHHGKTGKLVFGAEDEKRGYQRYAADALHPKTVVVKGI